MSRILAADIGNGYGKISVIFEGKEGEPLLLLPPELSAGMDTTAYVSPEGEIEVYEVKRKRPNRAVRAVKTRLNEEYIELTENGQTYTVKPEDIYAAVAEKLVTLANRTLESRGEESAYEVVLTYPCAFGDSPAILGKLKRSVESVVIDGKNLKVRALVSEAAAAATDNLFFSRNLASNAVYTKEHNVVVYDFGHGTVDVALVTSTNNKDEPYKLISQDGDAETGGRVLDDILFKEICSLIDYKPANEVERELIRSLAVEIKHELSNADSVERDVLFPCEKTVKITRSRFEELIRPHIIKTMELVAKQFHTAQKKGINVNAVILSGGCSNIPYIKKLIEETTENKIPVSVYKPSSAVSFGAARVAFALEDVPEESETGKQSSTVLEQYIQRDYGFSIPGGENGLKNKLRQLIKEGTKLPNKSEEIVLKSNSDCAVLRLACSQDSTSDGTNTIKEIIRMPFDVAEKAACKFSLQMDEDRCITVACTLPDGRVVEKKSFDIFHN